MDHTVYLNKDGGARAAMTHWRDDQQSSFGQKLLANTPAEEVTRARGRKTAAFRPDQAAKCGIVLQIEHQPRPARYAKPRYR